MGQLKIKDGNNWIDIPASGVGVPSGGTTGQVLQKSSNTDYATEWYTPQTLGWELVKDGMNSVTTYTVPDMSGAKDICILLIHGISGGAEIGDAHTMPYAAFVANPRILLHDSVNNGRSNFDWISNTQLRNDYMNGSNYSVAVYIRR